jgi:hypothetical protein
MVGQPIRVVDLALIGQDGVGASAREYCPGGSQSLIVFTRFRAQRRVGPPTYAEDAWHFR